MSASTIFSFFRIDYRVKRKMVLLKNRTSQSIDQVIQNMRWARYRRRVVLIIVTSLAAAAIWNMPRLIKRSFGSRFYITKSNFTSNTFTNESVAPKMTPSLPYCPALRLDLTPIISVDLSNINMSEVERKYPEVNLGGWYAPPGCRASCKVAIIVPYRDRMDQLTIFLNHMHSFLMNQKIEYGIFVVNQEGSGPFNRAKLFNVGFTESNRLKTGGWECFVFHDVDLLPLDGRNLYTCPRQPRHMSAYVDTHGNKLMYEELFGGVSAMTYEQFVNVNGFSNKYWGWGGEDDDMAYRVHKKKYKIERYPMDVARYTMLKHEREEPPNLERYYLLWLSTKNMFHDGLSSLNYKLVNVTRHRLYTVIAVNIDESILMNMLSMMLILTLIVAILMMKYKFKI